MSDPLWPEHFPACCPPPDAAPISGTYYCVGHEPRQEDDFLSALELRLFRGADNCQRASLSFWATSEAARALLDMPRHSDKVVLRLDCSSGDLGQGKATGKPLHWSIWFYRDAHAQLPQLVTPE